MHVRHFRRPLGVLTALWLVVATSLTGAASTAGRAIPESPAGTQLAWALTQINDGAAGLTEADVAGRFAPDYLAALNPAGIIGVLRDYVGAVAPVAIARFEGGVTDTRANAILTTASGVDWRIKLGVEPAAPHRIVDLFFEPAPSPGPPAQPPASWKALEARVRAVAPETSFVAAELVHGKCQPLATVNPNAALGIGSSFKLYVLGTLAHEVELGQASWDEPLAIRDDLKSLPSGDTRLAPAGTVFPLRYYAEQMISESDNTATDHLITRLGRENVEAVMRKMGSAAAARNTPLLLTREWFAMKLRFTQQQINAYVAADESTKRRMLATQADPAANTLTEDDDWVGSYLIDSVEWFASATDLCRALAYLHHLAGKPGLAPIHDALSLKPGLAWDAKTWTYVGYKGGYETGVKSDAWLLQRSDGRWFVVAGIINDPAKEINGPDLIQLMVAATNMLATTP